MAFTFDATSGGEDSNSYCTVEQADDYFAGRLNVDAWDALTDSDKEKVLVMATTRIEAERFGGEKTSGTQSLQFPREVIYDKDGYIYPSSTIPKGLINATCELALFYLERDEEGIMTEYELHDAQYLDNYKVGPLNYGFRKRAKADELPAQVQRELRGIGIGVWLHNTNGIMIR